MKKILSLAFYASLAAFTFVSCATEEDDIFDNTAAERLNAISDTYTKRMAASKDGWVMEYYATNDVFKYNEDISSRKNIASGMCFLLMADFDADGSVKIGMKNAFSGVRRQSTEDDLAYTNTGAYKEQTSLWEIIRDNGPVLSFNTYNEVFHTFTDPRAYTVDNLGYGISGSGNKGVGIGGDYEFIMVDVPENGDIVMLKGKKHGAYVRLTKLPEGTDFEAYLDDITAFQNKVFPKNNPSYNVLTVDGDRFKTNDCFSTIMNLYPYDGDELADESYHPFAITKRNGKYYLRFREKFTYLFVAEDREKKYDLQELVYDEEKDIFIDENNKETILIGAVPAEFFAEEVNGGKVWTINANSQMSESFKAQYDDLKAKMKSNGSYTLSSLQFSTYNGQPAFRVYYQNSQKKYVSGYFAVEVKSEGDNATITIGEPLNDSATSIYNKVVALQEFIATISGTAKIEAPVTRFNLSTVKMTVGGDSDKWVILQHN